MLQHAAGLRSSTGRIALGVDVKADGGYAIYWPAAGMPVLCDASSAPWPAWLLDALRPKPSPAPEKTTPLAAVALLDVRSAVMQRTH